MRILFWCDTLWPIIGGVEVLAAQFLRALKARGYEILIVTGRDVDELPAEESFEGYRMVRLAFRKAIEADNLQSVVKLRRDVTNLKRAFQPDLVHVFHFGPGNFFHLQTASAWPAPSVLSLHQTFPDYSTPADVLVGRQLRTADWVVGCSEAVLAVTRAQVPEITPRSSTILNSITVPDRPAVPPPAQPRLLCVGRLVPQKGFDLAIEALALLHERYPDLRLVLAGDGASRGPLERQVAELGLESVVEFLGWVDPAKVPVLMDEFSLVLMPSRDEPFGLVALQAAHRARPVVGTRVSGLPEVVLHGETGLLVERKDVPALAEAIAYLLERPAEAARLGQAARERARRDFTWDAHVDAYDALYRRLVGSQGR